MTSEKEKIFGQAVAATYTDSELRREKTQGRTEHSAEGDKTRRDRIGKEGEGDIDEAKQKGNRRNP